MNEVFGLFVILAVLGNSAFCKSYYPLPYKNQNEDYAGKFFESFFANPVANEGRNESLTTPAPPTTPKPNPTTETTVVLIPVYHEPIYDPNYHAIIPPYPVFYNAPYSSQLQVDNLAPYYPVANSIPPIHSSGLQPVPFLNPGPIAVPETSKPNSPTAKPTNLKPSNIQSPRENLNAEEIKDQVQKTLNKEVEKLLGEFYAKHSPHIQGQENIESSTKTDTETSNGDEDEYKIIKPWTTIVPEVSAYSVHNRKPSVTEKVVDEFNSEIVKTTQVNQFSTETAPQNETDDLRRLDFNNEEFTTDAATESPAKYFDTVLENNQTSADSKLKDRIIGESAKGTVISSRLFIDDSGNTCMAETVAFNDKQYNLVTCEEKRYRETTQIDERTTSKPNVTYFTNNLLSTRQSTTESTPKNKIKATNDLPEALD